MNIFQAIILGITQGLSEFLPVSSSGHLALLQNFWKIENPLSFDIVVHLGTLLAVLIFFRMEIMKLITQSWQAIFDKNKKIPNLAIQIIIGSIPAIIFGFLLKNKVNGIFNSLLFVGIGFFVTTLFLFLSGKFKNLTKLGKNLKIKNSLIIGCFQALAIIPGISRSGSTIVGGLSQKLKPETAFNFSFLLSIPAILGALVLDLPAMTNIESGQIPNFSLGFWLSFITGFMALKIFKNLVIKNKLRYFGFYTLVLGVMSMGIYFFR